MEKFYYKVKELLKSWSLEIELNPMFWNIGLEAGEYEDIIVEICFGPIMFTIWRIL